MTSKIEILTGADAAAAAPDHEHRFAGAPFNHPDRSRYPFIVDVNATVHHSGHAPIVQPPNTFRSIPEEVVLDAPHTIVTLKYIEKFREATLPPNVAFELTCPILYQITSTKIDLSGETHVLLESVHLEIFSRGRADLRFILVNESQMPERTGNDDGTGEYLILKKGAHLPAHDQQTLRIAKMFCYKIFWRATEMSAFAQEPGITEYGVAIVTAVSMDEPPTVTIVSQLHNAPMTIVVDFEVFKGWTMRIAVDNRFSARLQTATHTNWNMYRCDDIVQAKRRFRERFSRIAPSSTETKSWLIIRELNEELPEIWDRVGAFKCFKETEEQFIVVHNLLRMGALFKMMCEREENEVNEELGHGESDITFRTINHVGSNDWNACAEIFSAMYGRGSKRLIRGGRRITIDDTLLNQEQSDCINTYTHKHLTWKRPRIYTLHSPPGSGKTFTVACMARVHYFANPNDIQLLCSTTNVATNNIGKFLKELGMESSVVCNLKSTSALDMNNPKPYDLFDSMEPHRLARMRTLQLTDVSGSIFENPKLPKLPPGCSFKEAGERDPPTDAENLLWRVKTSWEANLSQKIILATVDTVLIKMCSEGNARARLGKVKSIIVDEASVLTEAALYALIRRFPKADIVLVGDPHQLPPYLHTPDDLAYELSMRSALDVTSKTGVASIQLNHVYRTTQALAEPYNRLSYNMQLVSTKQPTDFPLHWMDFVPKSKTQLLLCDVDGREENNTLNKSMHNLAEMITAIKILKRVKPGDRAGVLVICMYKEQRNRLKRALEQEQGLEDIKVMTVDKSKGSESKIVLLLTTKTHTSSEFFSNKNRATVALSRHQDALIILGDVSFLEKTDSWKEAIKADFYRILARDIH